MLQEKLMDDLRSAMKGRDKLRQSVVSLVRAAIKNAEIAQQRTMEDPDVLAIIAKEVKQRRESIEEFKKGNRPDLVAREEAEMAILLEYLPKQMSREEIIAAARHVISEVGAQGPADKGKVMPKLMSQVKGKADGREVNDIVTRLLSGQPM
jgi:uncharacterized protein YqeY